MNKENMTRQGMNYKEREALKAFAGQCEKHGEFPVMVCRDSVWLSVTMTGQITQLTVNVSERHSCTGMMNMLQPLSERKGRQ
ncbi:hypothetical protein [Escherichia coli]|uniref:hypothetical protein n=1 Tax=Escherichia coli TaxID=562 RepID=UPI000C2416F5|nr:hypothetical protein [Escherichia coli]PJI60766.1 hypothetical protein CTU84_01195 [Escherichia coli]PJI65338.1 hypothetical protein CTY41_00775 [Escherichia coli]